MWPAGPAPMNRLAPLLAVLIMVAGCAPEPATKATAPQAIATASVAPVAGTVRVPAAGALFGAWVKPESYSQQGRADAISGFEARLGRRLDIVNTYRRIHEQIG